MLFLILILEIAVILYFLFLAGRKNAQKFRISKIRNGLNKIRIASPSSNNDKYEINSAIFKIFVLDEKFSPAETSLIVCCKYFTIYT